MGLLDMFGTSAEDPRTMATLQLAAGLLGAPKGGGMQGLLAGMQGYTGTMAQAKEAERRKRLEEEQRAAMMEERNLRMEQLRGAMAEQAQQRQQAATDMGLLRTQMGEQAGPTQNGMPVQSGAFDPRMMLAQGGSLPGVMQGINLQQMLAPKAPEVRAGDKPLIRQKSDGTYETIYTPAPEAAKPEPLPSAVREYEYAKQQGFKGTFLDFQLQQKRAGATNVGVSYGSPMQGTDARGNPVFFAPNKDPNQPPVILQGITPPKKDAPVEFTKSISGLNELQNGLASYADTLKNNGGVNPVAVGSTRANLQASYTALQMGLKNAFELGALAGPDLSVLQGMLVDPTSPRAMLIGDAGVKAQLDQAAKYLQNRTKAVYEAHGKQAPTSNKALDPKAILDEADAIIRGGR